MRNRKRRGPAFILTAVLVAIVLTACSGTSVSGNGSTQSEETTAVKEIEVVPVETVSPTEAKVLVSVDDLSYGHSQDYVDRLKRCLTKADFAESNITVKEAGRDADKQLEDIKTAIKEEYNVLIVECVDGSMATEIANKAAKAGAAVIFVGTGVESAEIERWEQLGIYATYIDCDHSAQGTLRFEILDALDYEKLDSTSNHEIGYVVIESGNEEDSKKLSGSKVNADTIQAMKDAHYTMTEVTDPITVDSQEAAEEAVSTLLSDNGKDLEVIFCGSDEIALGAQQAVKDRSGLNKQDVRVVGIEATPASLQSIASGSLFCTLFEDYTAETDAVANAALYYVKGLDVEHQTLCSYVKVTVNNAREILDVTGWTVEESSSEGSTKEAE